MQVRFVDMLGFDRVLELPEGSTAGQMRTYIMESALYDMARTDMYRNGKILEGNEPFFSQTFADDNVIVLIDRRRISERSYPKVDYAFPVRAKYPPLYSYDNSGRLPQYRRGEVEDPEFMDDYQAEHDQFRGIRAFNSFALPPEEFSRPTQRMTIHRIRAGRRAIEELTSARPAHPEVERFRALMAGFDESNAMAYHTDGFERAEIETGRFDELVDDDFDAIY